MKKKMSALCLCVALVLAAAVGVAEDVPALEDDFYAAVNAQWLAETEIPADWPVAGGFTELEDEVDARLMDDFAAMLAGELEPGNELLASFVEFYRLAADKDAREAAGAEPLAPYTEMVEGLESLADYAAQWAQWDLAGMPSPFVAGVMADMADADTNALYLMAPGLCLLDRSYYEDEATKAMLQSLYGQMAVNLMLLAGWETEEAEGIVLDALAFDESLAPHTKSAEEASDYAGMYNPTSLAELDAAIEGFDLAAAFETLLGEVPETVIVTDPQYFAALDALVNEDTFAQMKSWMLVQTVCGIASYLSDAMRVEADSFGRAVYGIAEPTSWEKDAYYLATGMFSEVVGIYYGETYFGEEAMADVTAMVDALIGVYRERLAANEWLGEETREKAIAKLDAMKMHVGYPEEARPFYSQMQTVTAQDGGTLVDNIFEFTRLSKLDNYGDWNTPVDRGLWALSANTVNAMYSLLDNSINFPAAIMQAPFYSLEQPREANYGGIGAVIAHEISHAFDPNGAQCDENGSLAQWWTEEDYAAFEALSAAMVAEFDGIEHAGGVVSGALTVTENVADAGGLSCALEAITGDEDADLEAFFTSWAVIWRQKATPEYEALLLVMDVHAPSKLRANIQLQNLDAFFETFGIEEGDGMYRAPEDRVSIW